jgi:hypothetical protein
LQSRQIPPGSIAITSSTAIKGNKPRQIADEACIILLSGIKPDALYGLAPIVPFGL